MPNDRIDRLREERDNKEKERHDKAELFRSKEEGARKEGDPDRKKALEDQVRVLAAQIADLVRQQLALDQQVSAEMLVADPVAAHEEQMQDVALVLQGLPLEIHFAVLDGLDAQDLISLRLVSQDMRSSVEDYLDHYLRLREVFGPNAGQPVQGNIPADVKLGHWLNGQYAREAAPLMTADLRALFDAVGDPAIRGAYENALQRSFRLRGIEQIPGLPNPSDAGYLKLAAPHQSQYLMELLAAGRVDFFGAPLAPNHDFVDAFVGLAYSLYLRR